MKDAHSLTDDRFPQTTPQRPGGVASAPPRATPSDARPADLSPGDATPRDASTDDASPADATPQHARPPQASQSPLPSAEPPPRADQAQGAAGAAAPAPATAVAATSESGPEAPEADGFRPPHPDALKIEMIIGGLVAGVIGMLLLTTATVLTLFVDLLLFATLIIWAGVTLVLSILVFFLLIFPRRRHRRYRYRVDERGLEIREGVWWRTHRFIAHSRLQHSDVTQGPLERAMGLAKVVVHTAGTHAAATTVAGLSLERAHAVRDELTRESGEADGV